MKKKMEMYLLKMIAVLNYIIPKSSKRIFFYSSPDYSDNARAMSEWMVSNGLNNHYRIIWAVKNVKKYKSMLHNQNIRVVKHRSLWNLWNFYRSKYLVRTHSLWGNNYVEKRQIMCVAWHGMPLKSLVRVGEEIKPINCDFFNVTSDFFLQVINKQLKVPEEKIIVSGLPRNDYLFQENSCILSDESKEFTKMLIWMPTFRNGGFGYCDGNDSDFGLPVIKESDLLELDNILKKKNYLLFLKLHPWASNKLNLKQYSNIRLVEDDEFEAESLYTFISKMDALLTDYSSVYIDYLLLDRPIGFVYDDIDQYKKSRGFSFEPVEDYMPGEKICSAEELMNWIATFDENDLYAEQRSRLIEQFHKNVDAGSSERLLKAMGIQI